MDINYLGSKVLEFLNDKKVNGNINGNMIIISRNNIVEYICNKDNSLNEEECYEEFRRFLSKRFNKRFIFAMKTNDNLYLDTINANGI